MGMQVSLGTYLPPLIISDDSVIQEIHKQVDIILGSNTVAETQRYPFFCRLLSKKGKQFFVSHCGKVSNHSSHRQAVSFHKLSRFCIWQYLRSDLSLAGHSCCEHHSPSPQQQLDFEWASWECFNVCIEDKTVSSLLK